MYGCESWTIKKAECWRIDVFELWCWRRLLRVPWTARRSNQSILKDISPECSRKDWCWSWNSITLVTWCEELTHWKTLMLGKIEGGRRWQEDEMVGWHHWLNGYEFTWTLGAGDGKGGLVYCGSQGHKESDMTEWLNCTEYSFYVSGCNINFKNMRTDKNLTKIF